MRVLRYVILRHDGIPEPHFDLMFEQEERPELTTFRSPAWPIVGPTHVVKLADHRPAYLDYEGPISGERGHVKRVAAGTCQVFPHIRHQYTVKLLEPAPPQLLRFEQSPADYWVATISPAE
jgi:hypothetical protein